MLSCKLDFSSCAIKDGFCESSHKYSYNSLKQMLLYIVGEILHTVAL